MSTTGKSITYRLLSVQDFEEVLDFYVNEFSVREPTSIALKITQQEAEMEAKKLVKPILAQNLSLGAYDAECGQLLGINITSCGKYEKESMDETTPTFSDMQYSEVEEELFGPNLEETLGTNNYVNLHTLCIKSNFSGQGIGTELWRKMHDIAIKEGCTKACVIATSYYTQKIAKKFGYDFVKTIFYEKHVDPWTGQKIFRDVEKPHEFITLAVKSLQK